MAWEEILRQERLNFCSSVRTIQMYCAQINFIGQATPSRSLAIMKEIGMN